MTQYLVSNARLFVCIALFSVNAQSRGEVYRYDLPYLAVEYFVADPVDAQASRNREIQLKESFKIERIVDSSRRAIENIEPIILELRSALFPSTSKKLFKQLKGVSAQWKRGQLVFVVEWSISFDTPDQLYPFTLGTVSIGDFEVLEPRIIVVDKFQASVDDRESLMKIKSLEISIVIGTSTKKSSRKSQEDGSRAALNAITRANAILREYDFASLSEETWNLISLSNGFQFGVTKCRLSSPTSDHGRLLFWSIEDGGFNVSMQNELIDLD